MAVLFPRLKSLQPALLLVLLPGLLVNTVGIWWCIQVGNPEERLLLHMRYRLRTLSRHILPIPFRRWLVRHFRYPYGGKIDFGDLRRTRPISSVWGTDRGLPVDRYYITQFLASRAKDVRGHVLEVGNNIYTLRYGGDQVQKSDILHVSEEAPQATIVADLTKAEHIPSGTFDCIICTQTIHHIYEVDMAIATLYRTLKPEGVLLATFPGISQISRYDMDRWGDYWRFTSASIQRLFEKDFPAKNIRIQVFGNVLSAIAFLEGISSHELNSEELDDCDPDYEVLIGVRAVKPEAGE